jgi:hypothetical protein
MADDATRYVRDIERLHREGHARHLEDRRASALVSLRAELTRVLNAHMAEGFIDETTAAIVREGIELGTAPDFSYDPRWNDMQDEQRPLFSEMEEGPIALAALLKPIIESNPSLGDETDIEEVRLRGRQILIRQKYQRDIVLDVRYAQKIPDQALDPEAVPAAMPGMR